MDNSGAMDFEEVRRLLPQTHPMLMVDRVREIDPGKKIVAIKNVTGNEPFFEGHFPDLAIMPAALILEGLAQATILLARKSAPPADPGAKPQIYLFGSIHARMLRPVFPGDVLEYHVTFLKSFEEGGAAEGIASVDGEPCVKAEMYFSRVDPETLRQQNKK